MELLPGAPSMIYRGKYTKQEIFHNQFAGQFPPSPPTAVVNFEEGPCESSEFRHSQTSEMCLLSESYDPPICPPSSRGGHIVIHGKLFYDNTSCIFLHFSLCLLLDCLSYSKDTPFILCIRHVCNIMFV